MEILKLIKYITDSGPNASYDGPKVPALLDPQYGSRLHWQLLSENHFDFVSNEHILHESLCTLSQFASGQHVRS